MSALTTAQLDLIASYAAPLTPDDREVFINEVIAQLATVPELGPGVIHQVVRNAQSKFVDQRAVGVGGRQRPPPRSKYDRLGHFTRPRRAPA